MAAVGSRTQASADRFGDAHGIARRHASYEALAEDPEVDVVYVATPHVLHMENTLLCLNAGKAVLCEKPLTVNASEAEQVVARARERGLFLMEGMWTRFFPIMQRVREILAGGLLGDVRMLAADFGFKGTFDPEARLFNPALAGGALLDVGIYPLSLASMLWGAPETIRSLGHLGKTGVDEQAAMLLGYPGGRMAVLYTAVTLDTPVEATIMGTAGRLQIHHRWHHPTTMTLSRSGQPDEVIELPYEGNGMQFEARAVMEALRAGKQECELIPLDESLALMRTMDTLRDAWGLRYPSE